MLVCIVINTILKYVISELLGVGLVNYGNKYIAWDINNLISTIKILLVSLISQFKFYFLNTIFFKVYAIGGILFLIISVIESIKRRNVILFLLCLCGIASTLAFYMITGNAMIPTRILVVYAIFCAFVFSFLYYISLNKNIVKILMIICVVFIVFYQSREVQGMFNADYLRYQKDVTLARQINYEVEKQCGGQPSVPVVFIGSPQKYIDLPNEEDDPNMRSIFSGNDKNASIRIHSFFNMLGYNYINPINEAFTPQNYQHMGDNIITTKASKRAENMPIWPMDGSVVADENMVIVKLGPLEKQYYNVEKNKFDALIFNGNRLPATGDIEVIKVDGDMDIGYELYIKGYAYFNDISSRNTRISLVLDNNDEHYIFATQQYPLLNNCNKAPIDNDNGNLNQFITSVKINNMNPGEWNVRIKIDNGKYIQVIEPKTLDRILIK